MLLLFTCGGLGPNIACLGVPGCLRGLCIKTCESIFNRPSEISLFNCGTDVASSRKAVVKPGLRPVAKIASKRSLTSSPTRLGTA